MVARITFAPPAIASDELGPDLAITATKSSSNPTLNITGGMPENIVKVGTTYWLCYTFRSQTPSDHTEIHLASASSPTGSWTDDTTDNPILTLGSQAWEELGVCNGAWIVEDSGTFYLFYGSAGTGTAGAMGVATCSTINGTYAKYASNPILSPGSSGAWDDLRVNEPSVIKVGSTWVMAYMGDTATEGQNEKIGIATASSPTGTWTKSANNPVLGFGSTGDFDVGGAADPSLYHDGTRYWLWYSGLRAAGGHPWQIGLAYSTAADGPYTKHKSNPVVMTVGPAVGGTWENQSVWRGSIFNDSGTLVAPYAGEPSSAQSYDAKGGIVTLTSHY